MPLATVSRETVGPLYLETVEDGWIKVRKMGYGKHLKRQELAARVSQQMPEKGSKTKDDRRLDYTMLAEDSQLFVFRECLVDHNLEDENGLKIDLHTRMGIENLDGKVGEEIDKLIDMVNEREDISSFLKISETSLSSLESDPS